MAEGSQFLSYEIGSLEIPKELQPDNFVKTTRYTVLSFLPLTLFENFKRAANIYFLFCAIMCLFPWTPVSPVLQIFPLVFVVAVSMVKALIEDVMRYANDKKVNSTIFEIFRDGEYKKMQSREIRPGDIFKIPSGIEVPADMLILATSEKNGMCYANEVNLNGETAIKQRKAIFAASELTPEEAGMIKGRLTIPLPCKDINRLDGKIEVRENSFPFSMQNCILRGVFIKQTEYVVGCALYTGHKSRIIENQRHPPHKTSHLEQRLNLYIGFDFGLNIALVMLFSIMSLVKEKTFSFAFVTRQSFSFLTFLQNFSAFLILLSYMIPISLYVTIEFIRIFQKYFFATDLGMYTPGLGFCSPHNSNLNEELGCVDHIFSDKTGTLTENIMSFVQMSCRGIVYDVIEAKDAVIECSQTKDEVDKYLKCLSLCHGVIVSSEGYSSESPDEEALVNRTAELGYKLTSRESEVSITINIRGEDVTFPQLAVVPFTSARKRMSIIVKENDKIVMYVKGADSIVLGMIKEEEDQEMINITSEHVDAFAEQGLRTLVLGYREIPEEEFEAWKQRYDEASIELENRDENIARVGSEIEKDLTLLGAVAIEDKLQPNVPETVAYLTRMDIRFWVLTGDKKETAVSIAKSTNVILPTSPVFEFSTTNKEDYERLYQEIVEVHNPVAVISPESLQGLIELPELLVQIGDLCRSVVCFRMSPFLKSKVVEVIRTNTKRVTLAIGDGANDVNMIQTAHLGIGIVGREGHQAAANSDFAITRFKHLKRLLACHGRLSLLRLSGVILYMIMKNIVMIFPLMMYCILAKWTPVVIYDSFLLSTYNLIWTLLPPIEFGSLEQDLSFRSMLTYPYLYREARAGRYLSVWRFVLEFVNATLQSVVIFIAMLFFSQCLQDRGGEVLSFSVMGYIMFTLVVIVANLQAILRSHSVNTYLFLSVYLSIFVYILFTIAYGSLSTFVPSFYFVPQKALRLPGLYSTALVVTVLCLAPEGIFRYLKSMWHPSFSRIVRESEQLAAEGNPFFTVTHG